MLACCWSESGTGKIWVTSLHPRHVGKPCASMHLQSWQTKDNTRNNSLPLPPSRPRPHQVVGGNWVELPAGHYKLESARPATHCQLEAHIHYSHLVSHPSEGGCVRRRCT